MHSVTVNSHRQTPLLEFLQLRGFTVESLEDGIYHVSRSNELPVFVSISENSLYFECDICGLDSLSSVEGLYRRLLALNLLIQPVSLAINDTDPAAARLVLVEARESANLDDNEILSVFDAIELAAEKLSPLLSEHL